MNRVSADHLPFKESSSRLASRKPKFYRGHILNSSQFHAVGVDGIHWLSSA
jgi:hypothetical protein